MQLHYATATKFYIKTNEDTNLNETLCYVQSSYFGNQGSEEWEKDIKVLLPPGMSIIFDTDKESEEPDDFSVDGFLLDHGGAYVFILSNITNNSIEKEHGTIIYDIQDYNTRIKLDKECISIQTADSSVVLEKNKATIQTETNYIVLEDNQPAVFEANGVSMVSLFEGLIDEIKGLVTTGSAVTQVINSVSQGKLETFKATTIKKMFK